MSCSREDEFFPVTTYHVLAQENLNNTKAKHHYN